MNPARVISFTPLIWLSGFTPIVYQALGIWSGLRSGRSLRSLNGIEFAFVWFILVYTLSILFALVRGEDLVRAISGFYNLSIWVMGFFLIFAKRDLEPTSLRRSARFLLVLVLLLSWALVLAPGVANIYPTLLSSLVNTDALPVNFRNNTTLNIFGRDWSTFGSGYRVSIMSPYPTAYAMLVFLLSCLAWPEKGERWRIPFVIIIVPLAVYAAYLMGASRAVAGAFFLFFLLRVGFRVIRSFKPAQRGAITYMAALVVVIGLLAATAFVAALWEGINESRAGSSELRFRIYELSITSALSEHPLIGFGVKQRDDDIASIPLGSHSTLVSIFYKAGFLGLAALLAVFVQFATKAVRLLLASRATTHDRSIAAGILAFFPILVFEDIDALPLNAFIYFTMVALVLQRARSLVSGPAAANMKLPSLAIAESPRSA